MIKNIAKKTKYVFPDEYFKEFVDRKQAVILKQLFQNGKFPKNWSDILTDECLSSRMNICNVIVKFAKQQIIHLPNLPVLVKKKLNK